MDAKEPEYTPPLAQPPPTSLFNRIGLGGTFICAVVLVLLVIGYWKWFTTHRSKVVVEKHVVALQADSTESRKTIGKLQQQANDALAYGNRYKASRDSAVIASDRATGKLTYSQKVVAYLQALVNNKTLPEQPYRVPDLTSDDVVTAGLKTANREEIERKRGDSLVESIAVRDARLLALKEDYITLKGGVVEAKRKVAARAKGGIWPFNRKRKKQLHEGESDLEQVLNKTDKP